MKYLIPGIDYFFFGNSRSRYYNNSIEFWFLNETMILRLGHLFSILDQAPHLCFSLL